MTRSLTVDAYIRGAKHWQAELIQLRAILRSTSLTETVRWGSPCYTHRGKLVVGLGAFNSYVGLWFFEGALLADEAGVLVNAQEGKTRGMRQWRFTCSRQIKAGQIRAYVSEAIRLRDEGKQIKADRSKPLVIPRELKDALARHKRAGVAFQALSMGRQREYADYVAEAKRADTKAARLAKILPLITAGIGLNDKYRS